MMIFFYIYIIMNQSYIFFFLDFRKSYSNKRYISLYIVLFLIIENRGLIYIRIRLIIAYMTKRYRSIKNMILKGIIRHNFNIFVSEY